MHDIMYAVTYIKCTEKLSFENINVSSKQNRYNFREKKNKMKNHFQVSIIILDSLLNTTANIFS